MNIYIFYCYFCEKKLNEDEEAPYMKNFSFIHFDSNRLARTDAFLF